MGSRPLAAVFPDHVFPDGPEFSCLGCWLPAGRFGPRCFASARSGRRCTREPGHPGVHATCGALSTEHPVETWEG